MFAKVRIRTLLVLGGLLVGCNPPAHTLLEASRSEVFTTATCSNVDVSHVPSSDVPEEREDVYVAEGCGMRWRMACGSKHVTRCARRSNHCTTRLEWECSDIQPEGADVSDDELRTRIARPDDMNILGS